MASGRLAARRSQGANVALILSVALASSWPRVADALIEELYTTNSVCRERYCINPVFPAMDKLPAMEEMRWQKRALGNVSKFMGFCGSFVDYDPSVAVANTSKEAMEARRESLQERLAKGIPVRFDEVDSAKNAVEDVVMAMDRAAARRYFFHLAGMGIDGWEHQSPADSSTLPLRRCARSVAKLVCFTFFPKANPKFPVEARTEYVRPCRSSCETYLKDCGVDCCDQSLQCTWGGEAGGRPRRTESESGQPLMLQTGYYDAAAPCEHCTGAAAAMRVPLVALLALLGSFALV